MEPETAPQSDPATPPAAGLASAMHQVAAAQATWAQTSLSERRNLIRYARLELAASARELAAESAESRARPVAEVLSAEVLPLIEAYRWIERNLVSLLSPQNLGKRGRPLWLRGVRTEIRREPRGTVLVIAPSNYPLLLPGVQIVQALAAGNAVLLKPAPGTATLAWMLCETWRAAGLPVGVLQLLPETPDSAHAAIRAGVQLVVLTGSAEAGEAVLRTCAETITPAIVELSGCDVAIVREDADVELAAEALVFGMRLNGGATCIAPRRVLAARRVAERLEAALARLLETEAASQVPPRLEPRVREALDRARQLGAAVLCGGGEDEQVRLPLVLSSGDPDVLIEREIFGSVLSITFVDSDEQALVLAQRGGYALGASIFSCDEAAAQALAARVNAGVVIINDMIVPTADPRIPFGGRGRSGFGVTRGAEGLLAMTVSKVITVTPGRERIHFRPVGAAEEELFAGYIQAAHAAGWRARWAGLRQLWRGVRQLAHRKGRLPAATQTPSNE